MSKSDSIFKTLTEKPWEKGQVEIDVEKLYSSGVMKNE